jgi:hypothetical protein
MSDATTEELISPPPSKRRISLGKRGPYVCSQCRQPKRLHQCPIRKSTAFNHFTIDKLHALSTVAQLVTKINSSS